MIDRHLKDKLLRTINTAPAVALLGARQIGKTTLAREIAQETPALYLDLESPEDLTKLSDPTAFLRSHSDKLIILDEIQRAPEIFSILRGLIDHNRQQGKKFGQFLLLGSASMDLLKQSSQSLAGRISYLEMTGLTSVEISDTLADLKKLWFRGGFPESYLAASDTIAIEWLENLIRTYLERDIPQLGFRIPASRLRRLWTMIAHLQGETLNVSKLAMNLEVDSKTVKNYLDILTDMLLLRRLDPWHANTKKRLVKSPRYYVRDSGIQHRLLGINSYDQLLSNPALGKSWEGFVVENIFSVLPRQENAYFYRTSAGAEIDLVIDLSATQKWAIEIKYGTSPKLGKHFDQTCNDVKATHKFVVYSGTQEFPIQNGATAIPLSNLMKKLTLPIAK